MSEKCFRVTRNQTKQKRLEELKTSITAEPKPKDPSPYLKKYRQKKPESMKQLTLNQDGSLNHTDKPVAPEPTKTKCCIPKKKAQPKTADKPITDKHIGMLEDLLKDISDYESEADKYDHITDLDELLNKGSEMTKHANKLLKPPQVQEKEEPNTCVNVDVFKLIAEKLITKQSTHLDLLFANGFAVFEKYLNKSFTKRTCNSISDPVFRLQVMFVRLMMNYIENASSEADSDQFGLSEELFSFASKFENSSSTHFTPDDLFPPFYFAVQQLVKVYTNWEKLPWLFDESDFVYDCDNEDSVYMVETQAARLRRRVEDVWSSLLTVTLKLLQSSKGTSSSLFYCSTGTAFLFVILVAKSWFNLIFFNRLEPKLENHVQTSKCWNLIADFGRTICALYHDDVEVCPVEEVLKLFYPFLLYYHEDVKEDEEEEEIPSLLLSYEEVDSLLSQLVAMNPECHNQLHCAYFQMAFRSMHYHLVWEQLSKQPQESLSTDDIISFLEPYNSLSTVDCDRVFNSWKAVFGMMLTAQSIPFTGGKEQQAELFWFDAKPVLVLKLLMTLSTIIQKYVITECAGKTRNAGKEFKQLRNIISYFESQISRSQFMSRSIVQSIKCLIGGQ